MDKLENIYKLLIEHNFDANKNVPDEFKCGKCRKLLIEACQTRCGCRFCRSCVDEMMNNGCQFCPGITNDCKIELLSSVVIDYRANKQISELIMNCPEEMCSYECELLEMSEHLRICGKKSVECPFYKLGCDWRKMTNEKLIEHFQLENYNHNKTLIEMIDNIKNEVEELREKELRNHQEINKLKADLQLKDEKLESINAKMEVMKIEKMKMEKDLEKVRKMFNLEIKKLKSEHAKELKSVKTEQENLEDQIQIGLKNIRYKINEIELGWKKQCENDENKSINPELIEKIEILQKRFDNKIEEIQSINKKEINLIIESIKLEIIEVCKQLIDESVIDQKIDQLERNVENKANGIFEWKINNVDELRKIYFGECRNSKFLFGICSEYFYTEMYPCKLRVRIRPFSDELCVYLRIYEDADNRSLSFPFTADVTIKIINKYQRELSKSITKYCQIEKPENNSYKSTDEFIYSISNLTKSGIFQSNGFVVQCGFQLK